MLRIFLTSAVGLAILASCPGCGGKKTSVAPAKAVAMAWEDYDAALYDEAELLFDDAAQRTSGSDELHLRALYGQASTVNLRRPGGDPVRARPIYVEVTRIAPKSDWAAWSLLALARMTDLPSSGERRPLPEMVAAYQTVIDQFPFHRAGEEAFTFQQCARIVSFDRDEARLAAQLMERFVVEHPESTFRSVVYRLLGRAYEITGEYEKALAASIKFYELYHVDPNNPRSDYASVYWSIATLANYRVGDFVTARRFYELMIKEYPTERRVFTAKLAMRTMDETEAQLRIAPQTPAP